MTLLNAKVQTSRATAVAGVGMVVCGVRCVCARSSRARGFARSRSWRLADCCCVYKRSQVATRDAAVDVQGELIVTSRWKARSLFPLRWGGRRGGQRRERGRGHLGELVLANDCCSHNMHDGVQAGVRAHYPAAKSTRERRGSREGDVQAASGS